MSCHCWLLPAEAADLPLAICSCSLLLLFASFLLWTVTLKEKGGRDTAAHAPDSHFLLNHQSVSHFHDTIPASTQTLKAFCNWACGVSENALSFLRNRETRLKWGKRVEIFVHLADVKIFGISNQKHQDINVRFG